MRVLVAPLAAAVLLSFSSHAQVRGTLPEQEAFMLGGATVLPAPDLNELKMEDAKRVGGPFRYGVAVSADDLRLGAPGFGAWSEEGDMAVWRWEVVSPAAKSLDFHFARLQLPLGARLDIIGAGDKENRRRIEPKHLSGTAYSSPYISGERARFELRVPQAKRHEVELEIASVTHGYRGLFEAFEAGQKSGSCNVDTACPAGDAWRDQIDAVGHYTFSKSGSSYVCTGTLLGNTATTTTPYFLTANHCMSTQAVVGTIVVYWNYQSATCRTPGSTSSGTSLSRSIATHSQSGATLRATNAASDFALIELSTAVPTAANPFFSGWDRSGNTPSSAVGIHHPAGHEKRIALENHALQVSGYGGASGTTHWRVVDWDQGTTEGGSSGSGLWDQNKRLVGQLHGGSAACGNDLSDYYGRLSVSWTGGGSNATRLSNWLDPAGTGATTLNGYRPGGGGGSDTVAPSTPGTPSASAGSASAITLSWGASTDSGGSGLSGYRIERCSGASCSNFAQIGTSSGTSYSDTGLAASTTYRYRVRAYDGAGNVSAYSAIAQATTQSSGGGGGGTALSNGVAVTGLSAASGAQLVYTLAVPAGATNLKFSTSGGSGDADLYVKFGSAPTTSSYDCRSWATGNTETCNISSAQAGTYYVMVNAYSAFSGLSLTGSYTASGGGGTAPSFFENTTDYTIVDRATVDSPITVSGRSGNAPSNLKVNVRIIHTYKGDLQVSLIGPNGATVATLHNRTGGSTDNVIGTYTVNASAQTANGTWKLRVYDAASGDTGYIDSWSLQF